MFFFLLFHNLDDESFSFEVNESSIFLLQMVKINVLFWGNVEGAPSSLLTSQSTGLAL